MTDWRFITASMESRNQVPELRDLIARTEPDVVNMSQAYNIADWAKRVGRDLGYRFHQPRKFFNREAHCVGLLIKEDIDITDKHVLRMHEEWKGPKSGLEHKPRIYPGLGLSREAIELNLIGMHAPTHNMPDAQAETWRRLNLFADRHPHRPLVVVGDFNAQAAELARVQPQFEVCGGTKVDHLEFQGKGVAHKSTQRHHVPDGLHGFVGFVLEMS